MKNGNDSARFLPLLAMAALYVSPQVQAQALSTTEHQRLDPQGLDDSARFGSDLAMSGDTLVIGAPLDTVGGQEAGTVHIYVSDGSSWSLQQVLVPAVPTLGMRFGARVAIDGDRVLIGAPVDSRDAVAAGAAYVYERTGTLWTETARIVGATPTMNFNFGSEVALEGDHCLISGRNLDGTYPIEPPNEVNAYSLQGTNWQLDQTLKYSGPGATPANEDFFFFGSELALEGNTIAISTDFTFQVFTRSGSTWTPEQAIVLEVGGPSIRLAGLALEEDLVAVSVQDLARSVLLYRRSGGTWTLEADVQTSFGEAGQFARSVAIENQRVLVGSLGLAIGSATGAVSLLEQVGLEWVETLVVVDSQEEVNSGFGSKVAIADDQLIVAGSAGDPFLTGNAYAYDLNERPASFCDGDGADVNGCGDCPCGNDAPPGSVGGCLNVSGTSAALSVSGAPSVTADTLRFELTGANPSTFAILVSASQQAPANASNPCFGVNSGIDSPALRGLRCVVQDVRRQGTRAIDAQGSVGDSNAGWGGNDGPTAGLLAQGGLVAGQTRHFQAFYREGAATICQRDQNTTQGISIIVRP